jgi:hypothetical protein
MTIVAMDVYLWANRKNFNKKGITDIDKKIVAVKMLIYAAIKPHILKRRSPIKPIIADKK